MARVQLGRVPDRIRGRSAQQRGRPLDLLLQLPVILDAAETEAEKQSVFQRGEH